MSQSMKTIQRHVLRITARWPTDLLRPEVSFQESFRKRLDENEGRKDAGSTTGVSANGAQATITTAPSAEITSGHLDSLYSLLEDRYQSQYPLSGRSLKPASNPDYYTNFIKEMRTAPHRPWYSRTINKWKGFLRFS